MDILALLIIGFIPLFIIAIIYEMWLKKKDIEQKENVKLEQVKLNEIKQLLKEHKNLTEIKKKIQDWKYEGYDVSELENLIEKANE